MGKLSGLGLGEIKKVSGLGLGAIKKISGLGLGVIWSAFAPAGMVHSGAAVNLTTSFTQVGNWVADPARPGSSVTGGNALVIADGGLASITSSVLFANSAASRTISIEIRVNGSAVATGGGTLAAFASGVAFTANTAAPVTVPAGASVTYWAMSSATTGTASVMSDAASYVRVTPPA